MQIAMKFIKLTSFEDQKFNLACDDLAKD